MSKISLSELANRGDRFIDTRLPQSPEAKQKRRDRIIRPLGAAASLVAATGLYFGANKILETYDEPKFSDTTTTYTFGDNEGLSHAAAQVEGVEDVDSRDVQRYISEIPANEPVLADGIQPSETVVIPEEVKP